MHEIRGQTAITMALNDEIKQILSVKFQTKIVELTGLTRKNTGVSL